MAVKWVVAAVLALSLFGVRGAAATAPCFTTDGAPQIVAALDKWAAVSGVRNCGVSASPDVYLLRERPAWALNGYPGSTLGGAVFLERDQLGNEALALHEVGHALGLPHSASRLAAMSSIPAGVFLYPQPDDIAAITALYGARTAPLRYGVRVGVGRD